MRHPQHAARITGRGVSNLSHMKIAVITHCFPTEENLAAGNFLEPFLDEIQNQGHAVWVITPRMGTVVSQPYPVHTFPWPGGNRLLGQLRLWKPRDAYIVLKFLSEEKNMLFTLHNTIRFDHVLAAWLLPNALAAQSLKKKYGIPYSTWSLGSDINRFVRHPLSKMLLKNLLTDADVLFANSNHLCRQITALSKKDAVFLPTYRPLEKPPSSMIPRLRRESYHFLCVARLEKVKGVDVLIDAFRAAANSIGNDICLHILGDGSQRSTLEKIVRENNLQETVHFYGMASPVKVAAFLSVVDCLILPSRSEGMPIAFWEAQAAGIPVIGTDVGDLGWAIRNFGQGIVVPPENIPALKNAIHEVLRKDKKVLQPKPNAHPPHPRQIAITFLRSITESL
jgi:glycosyltransferase involved in cell wall biosynthesis